MYHITHFSYNNNDNVYIEIKNKYKKIHSDEYSSSMRNKLYLHFNIFTQ